MNLRAEILDNTGGYNLTLSAANAMVTALCREAGCSQASCDAFLEAVSRVDP